MAFPLVKFHKICWTIKYIFVFPSICWLKKINGTKFKIEEGNTELQIVRRLPL